MHTTAPIFGALHNPPRLYDYSSYGERGLFAFEVKREGKVRSEALRGLKAFLDDYPEAKAYFVYGGDRVMREGPIEILPFSLCLQKLPQLLGR